ncbi:MAG: tyrosine-type recombinase/integrase [Pseudobdellovibrio sp.]
MKKNEILPVLNAEFQTLSTKVEKKKKQKRWQMTREKFLSDTEYSKLRSFVKHKVSRFALLLKLYMFTGARAHEGLRVHFKDLDYATKTIFISGLKGSLDREIPLPSWYFYQLWHYAKKNCKSENDLIFPFSYTLLIRFWHLIRPVKKKLHALRHTLAIKIFKKYRDIKLVQITLGHKSINNTMVYLEFVYSQEELRKILKVGY